MLRKCLPAALIVLLSTLACAEPYADKPGKLEVSRLLATWKDAKRDREIPILINYPKDLATSETPLPVIVFSHGLGGARDTYEAYGKHWASFGYVVIFPQHHGSDTPAVLERKSRVVVPEAEVKNFLDRTDDIRYILDQLELLNAGKIDGKEYEPFKNKLDLKKIGMGGHSFGAITTQAMVGQTYDLPIKGTAFTDSRITAGVAMSPYPPLRKNADLDEAFGSIKIPVLYMTGTEDNLGVKSADRKAVYDHSKPAGTTWINFQGATHMTFAPLGRPAAVGQPATGTPDKATFQNHIRQVTTAWWDAKLKGDEKAKTWLKDSLPKNLDKLAQVESKK